MSRKHNSWMGSIPWIGKYFREKGPAVLPDDDDEKDDGLKPLGKYADLGELMEKAKSLGMDRSPPQTVIEEEDQSALSAKSKLDDLFGPPKSEPAPPKPKLPSKEGILSDLERIDALCRLNQASDRYDIIDAAKGFLQRLSNNDIKGIIEGVDKMYDSHKDLFAVVRLLVKSAQAVRGRERNDAFKATLKLAFEDHRGREIDKHDLLFPRNPSARKLYSVLNNVPGRVYVHDTDLYTLLLAALQESSIDVGEKQKEVQMIGDHKKNFIDLLRIYAPNLSEERIELKFKWNSGFRMYTGDAWGILVGKNDEGGDLKIYGDVGTVLSTALHIATDAQLKNYKRHLVRLRQQKRNRYLKFADKAYTAASLLGGGGAGIGMAYVIGYSLTGSRPVLAGVAAATTLMSYLGLKGLQRAAGYIFRTKEDEERRSRYQDKLFKPALQGSRRINTDKIFEDSR